MGKGTYGGGRGRGGGFRNFEDTKEKPLDYWKIVGRKAHHKKNNTTNKGRTHTPCALSRFVICVLTIAASNAPVGVRLVYTYVHAHTYESTHTYIHPRKHTYTLCLMVECMPQARKTAPLLWPENLALKSRVVMVCM